MPKLRSISYLPRWYYLLVLVVGASLTLAFAPFEWRIVSILAPAVLFYVLSRASTTLQHLKLSYIFALGMFGTGVSWIFYSMYFFSHAHFLFAGTLTALFVALMSITFFVLAFQTSRFNHAHLTLKLLVLYPAAWVITEWFRGWFLTGFPWLYLGHSHIDTLLIHIAPVAGSFGVSFLSALLSGALVLVITGHLKQRMIAVATAIIVIFGSFLLGNIAWVTAVGEPVKVSLLQGNVPQEKKWLPESLQPTLALFMSMTEKNWDADLIIWPETALPDNFGNHLDDLIYPLQAKSKEHQTDILMGGLFYNEQGKPNPGTENSILAITPELRSIYSKRHLVPFSEYMPFLKYLHWLNDWIQLPYDSFRKGTGPTTLEVAGITAQMSVCYEDAYGNETIRGLPEANMLINISNDGWFTGSIEPEQHMEIARMRSVETGRYMLRGTNIGVSGIINEKGEIIATAPLYTTTTIKGEAQPFSGSTPYVKMGNWLIIGLLSAIIIFASWFYLPCSYRKHD